MNGHAAISWAGLDIILVVTKAYTLMDYCLGLDEANQV